MDLERSLYLEMYRRMYRIRQFELSAKNLFMKGYVKGTVHPYIGEEASGVGICLALHDDDLIAGTHRSHGHNIAKGAKTDRMMAEILGKATGYCQGFGGSMHIAAFETGSLGAFGLVGASIPIALGAGLAFKMRGEKRVAVSFSGDGGCNTGNFHESLNMASIWNVPVIFVIENNHYAVSTNCRTSSNIEDFSIRAAGYGIPGIRVDGFDPVAVYQAATEAVERARNGEGPTLLVTECYRIEGHYAGEPEVYRTKDEVNEVIREHDPVTHFRQRLLREKRATEKVLVALEQEIDKELENACQFALESQEPDHALATSFIYM